MIIIGCVSLIKLNTHYHLICMIMPYLTFSMIIHIKLLECVFTADKIEMVFCYHGDQCDNSCQFASNTVSVTGICVYYI